jgi:hypothetical protein
MLTDVIEQVALVTGRVLHEGSGLPVVGSVTVTALEGSVYSRVFKDGVFVVSGKVEQLFPALATQPYNLTLLIRANSAQFIAGFAEITQTVAITQNESFDGPLPLPLPDGTLYFPAGLINIRGGVAEAGQLENPISSATIEILQGGANIASTATDVEGRYRLNSVTLTAPSEIRCSVPGFTTQTRPLLVDFSQSNHREDFQLPTP